MRKRILYTIPNFDTAGSGKALLHLAMGLDKNEFKAHIACTSTKGKFFEVVRNSGVPVHILPLYSPLKPKYKLAINCVRLALKFRKIKPDVIHSFHYGAEVSEGFSAFLARIPYVFTKKNMSWHGGSYKQWLFRSWLAKRIAIQNTDMKKSFYPTNDKTYLVPRGVATEQFALNEAPATIREHMNTMPSDRVVICVANMVPVKGVEILIAAFQQISKKHKNVKLWLIGDNTGEYGKKLENEVSKRELSNLVFFSGKVSNVVDYLSHAEIFVLPTLDEGRREGSPVALLEAMANSKVVIASNIPGIRDQLANHVNHMFKAGDSEALATLLDRFLENSVEENTAIGRDFCSYVNTHHHLNGEIAKHQELYRLATK